MDLLARREHSRRELARKLARVDEASTELIAEVVDELAAGGLQSDQRFAEALARRRASLGYGPLRLVAELREHALEAEGRDAGVEITAPEWTERARTARCKRFGEALPGTPREVARQLRFLQYRGFTTEQARQALGRADDT